ncbi:hypothetical protein EC957_005695 [Mortierella hygrophila]|uniref:Uncharacterized protein n=1 Tax=Mortierella hygrophila TaxID=979708 RepID=A0A9P6FEL3_9FUNG|nr:hypothetical protein EC957_005695 [Mortierella hygrophila]
MRKHPPRLKILHLQILPPFQNPDNQLQFLQSVTSPRPFHHRICEIDLTAPLAEVSENEEAEGKEGVDDFLEEFGMSVRTVLASEEKQSRQWFQAKGWVWGEAKPFQVRAPSNQFLDPWCDLWGKVRSEFDHIREP